MSDPIETPFLVVLRFACIARHVEEAMSDEGHVFDLLAVKSLLEDADVQAWMAKADALSLLPVKR